MAKAIVHISAKEEAKQQKGEKKFIHGQKLSHHDHCHMQCHIYILESNCQWCYMMKPKMDLVSMFLVNADEQPLGPVVKTRKSKGMFSQRKAS